MRVIAIDPGKTASFAKLDRSCPQEIELGTLSHVGSGRLIRPCPMHLAELLADVDTAIVEEVGARPLQGVSSVFTFGLSLGSLLGAIGAAKISLVMVSPSQWKKSSRINVKETSEAKDAARSFARELWPQHEKLLRVKGNHGLAEAALMARWYFHAGPGRFVDPLDSTSSETWLDEPKSMKTAAA
jgi:crossover junction endodeoxyribonuclease RuvC